MSNELKPREQWNEDEQHDGRPKMPTIDILIVSPGQTPRPATIANTLDAMQGVVGGTICCFPVGVEGAIGVGHDEAILLQMPMCRYIEQTGAIIFGTFFIAGNGINMHSLRPHELAQAQHVFDSPITIRQVFQALRREEETMREIEAWNLEWEKGEG